jgi:hypothetical protein
LPAASSKDGPCSEAILTSSFRCDVFLTIANIYSLYISYHFKHVLYFIFIDLNVLLCLSAGTGSGSVPGDRDFGRYGDDLAGTATPLVDCPAAMDAGAPGSPQQSRGERSTWKGDRRGARRAQDSWFAREGSWVRTVVGRGVISSSPAFTAGRGCLAVGQGLRLRTPTRTCDSSWAPVD